MKTRELLAALMERSKENPHSLSVSLRGRVKQPQIYKFINGISKEPRRTTLEPIADYYGVSVEAFYDEGMAAQLLAQMQSGVALGKCLPGKQEGQAVYTKDPIAAPVSTSESAKTYILERAWPFETVSRELWDSLTERQKGETEFFIKQLAGAVSSSNTQPEKVQKMAY